MKTILPISIITIEQAKAFLTDLYNNSEIYHPEDDAHGVIWHTCDKPVYEEAEQLNKLMNDIYTLKGNENSKNMAFCPCEFLFALEEYEIQN